MLNSELELRIQLKQTELRLLEAQKIIISKELTQYLDLKQQRNEKEE